MGYRGRSGFGYGSLRKAQRVHARRSNRAKRVDESLRAPIAKTSEQWMQQPNRFDLPEVDTPKKGDDKDAELKRQLERIQANRMRSSHREFRQRLNMHKYSGITH